MIPVAMATTCTVRDNPNYPLPCAWPCACSQACPRPWPSAIGRPASAPRAVGRRGSAPQNRHKASAPSPRAAAPRGRLGRAAAAHSRGKGATARSRREGEGESRQGRCALRAGPREQAAPPHGEGRARAPQHTQVWQNGLAGALHAGTLAALAPRRAASRHAFAPRHTQHTHAHTRIRAHARTRTCAQPNAPQSTAQLRQLYAWESCDLLC